MNELRADISKGICTFLHDRILLLEPYGLMNLWLQAGGDDIFNAGTVLGYRSDDWETIKKYSGLWREDGNLSNVEIWHQKLNGIRTIRRKFQSTMLNTRSLWLVTLKRIMKCVSLNGKNI